MSENYENATQQTLSPDVGTETAAELEALVEELNFEEEKQDNPEKNMTTGQKLRRLFMKPLATSIIKWALTLFGIAGVVLYFVATSSKSTGEDFAEMFGPIAGMIASLFSSIPVSVIEIVVCATALGLLAYLIFIIVRTFQVKGGFRKGGLWIQFFYTLVATASIYALLGSVCYGIFTYRQPLSKATKLKNVSNAMVYNKDLGETMLYLIDNINNTLVEGDKAIMFRNSGESRYSSRGSSTEKISKEVYKAFKKASKDFPTLKGEQLSVKELIFAPIYSKMQVASIYSPFTGEICINPDYPEIFVPMQIAKTMAVQRGYTDDAESSFIAYLVCTQYSDDYYLNYSGYFNAYLEVSSKFYDANDNNLHLYMADALKESAKKEFVAVVKNLDELYGNSSEITFKASTKLSADKYQDVAKLKIVNFRENFFNNVIKLDNSEAKNYGKFCNYLVNHYLSDADFQEEVNDTYLEYHPEA